MFANRKRYPDFLSFSPIGQGGHIPSLKSFLRMYMWTTLTVFCDSTSNYPNISPFYGLACRSINRLIAAYSKEFIVYYENFDSMKNTTNLKTMLLRAGAQSRGKLIKTPILNK
jgi:hypothetical protein